MLRGRDGARRRRRKIRSALGFRLLHSQTFMKMETDKVTKQPLELGNSEMFPLGNVFAVGTNQTEKPFLAVINVSVEDPSLCRASGFRPFAFPETKGGWIFLNEVCPAPSSPMTTSGCRSRDTGTDSSAIPQRSDGPRERNSPGIPGIQKKRRSGARRAW